MLAAGVPTYRPAKKYPHGPWKSQAVAEKLHVRGNAPGVDPKSDNFCQGAWRYDRKSNEVYQNDYNDYTDPYDNLPGLGFKGLGVDRPPVIRANIARTNDSLKDSTGIWSG
jgi:hypothetical protein